MTPYEACTEKRETQDQKSLTDVTASEAILGLIGVAIGIIIVFGAGFALIFALA